jgi:hypothetical protein
MWNRKSAHNDEDDNSSYLGPISSGDVDDADISQPPTALGSRASTPSLVLSSGDHGGKAIMARRVTPRSWVERFSCLLVS